MKSVARQNSAGAKTEPCLTLEVVVNGVERRPARRTLADVAVCKSTIIQEYTGNSDIMHGLPECGSVYGVKRCLEVHECGIQRLFPPADAVPGLHPVWSDNG